MCGDSLPLCGGAIFGDKKLSRRARFREAGELASGSAEKRGAFRGVKYCFAVHTSCGVVLARKDER